MPNPHAITTSEGFNALLKDTLSFLAVAFMFCFFNTLARANVYAMYGCSLSLILASSLGFIYTYDILAANHSSWPVVLKVINLVAFTSIIAQEIWFIHKAYKQIFSEEKLKFLELRLNFKNLLCKKETQLREKEELLSKWDDILSKRECIADEQADTLIKWEEALIKQEEELTKEKERVTKAERPDSEGPEI